MNNDAITTRDLDRIARIGLSDIEASFAVGATEKTLENAERALKIISRATKRMGAETNQLSVMFKVAKAVGLPPEDVIPIWKRLAASSLDDATGSKGKGR